MLYRGIVDNGELLGGLQLERTKAGDVYTGLYTGFTELEDGFLALLSCCIGLKCAQLRERTFSEIKEKTCAATISTIASLLETRMYSALLVKIRQALPSILGYESAGVYLHDPTCNLRILYSQ